jgi:hypothetical protein
MSGSGIMKQIRLGTFMIAVAVISVIVSVTVVLLLEPPDPFWARLEIQRLKLLKSNLHRAGVLGPNREKGLAHQIAELEAWGY